MMHSTNVTHLAKDCLFAPDAKISDGIIWLVVIQVGISRHQLLQVKTYCHIFLISFIFLSRSLNLLWVLSGNQMAVA